MHNMLNMLNFVNFGGFAKASTRVNEILEDTDLDDQEKLKELMRFEQIKSQVGSMSNNSKLLEFLQKKEVLMQLVKYSVSVPSDLQSEDESYKFPSVAQEILCQSAMISQSLLHGGYVVKKVPIYKEKKPKKAAKTENADAEWQTVKPKAEMKKKGLSLQLDDDSSDEDQVQMAEKSDSTDDKTSSEEEKSSLVEGLEAMKEAAE